MIVLDASALLAFLFREAGHEQVAARLSDACMSAVNLSEVLGRFSRDGLDAAALNKQLQLSPIEFVDFDEGLALRASELLPICRSAGLSLGARACLALAAQRSVPALTADKAWATVDHGVALELIR